MALKIRVRLVIPDADSEAVAHKIECHRMHGEHYGYHGRAGVVLCGSGSGGVWVGFDGEWPNKYVGVPIAWLEAA